MVTKAAILLKYRLHEQTGCQQVQTKKRDCLNLIGWKSHYFESDWFTFKSFHDFDKTTKLWQLSNQLIRNSTMLFLNNQTEDVDKHWRLSLSKSTRVCFWRSSSWHVLHVASDRWWAVEHTRNSNSSKRLLKK